MNSHRLATKSGHLLAISLMSAIACVGCGDDDETGSSGTGASGTGGTSDGGSGATSTGGTGGTGGSGGFGGTPVNPDPCDVFAQDCVEADASKCSVTFTPDESQNPPSCQEAGDAAIGEVCERPTGEPGIDTCDVGGYCAFWSSNGGERTCHAFCDDTNPCTEAGYDCFLMGTSGGPVGVCALQCTALGDECDGLTGSSCKYWSNPGVDGMFMCAPDGAGALGDPCLQPQECGAGSTCILANGASTCRGICDTSNDTCAASSKCQALPGTDPGGFCQTYDWSCVGSVVYPAPGQANATITLTLSDLAGNLLDGATLKACDAADFNCASPVDEQTSDATGTVAVTVPTGANGFVGYLEISHASIATSLVYAEQPIVEDITTNFDVLSDLSAGGWGTLFATPPTFDVADGQLLYLGNSCNDESAIGTSIDVSTADGGTAYAYYNTNFLFDETVTEANFLGLGFARDLAPGTATVTSTIVDTATVMGTRDVIVRAGEITLLFMTPTP